MPIQDLTLGIGATYNGKVFLNNTNHAFVPEAFGVDAMIAYQFGNGDSSSTPRTCSIV